MSRWLRSVNTLLEKLDDGAETAASVAVDAVDGLQREVARARRRQRLGRERGNGNDDEYDDEEGYSDDDDDDNDEEYEDYDDEDEDDADGDVSYDGNDGENEGEEEVDFESDDGQGVSDKQFDEGVGSSDSEHVQLRSRERGSTNSPLFPSNHPDTVTGVGSSDGLIMPSSTPPSRPPPPPPPPVGVAATESKTYQAAVGTSVVVDDTTSNITKQQDKAQQLLSESSESSLQSDPSRTCKLSSSHINPDKAQRSEVAVIETASASTTTTPSPAPIPTIPLPPSSSGAFSASSSTATGASSASPSKHGSTRTGTSSAAAGSSNNTAAARKAVKEYKRTIEKLEKTNAALTQQNQHLQREVDAQQLELLQAAQDIAEEREEHKEEIREMEEQYREQVRQIHQDYQSQLAQMKQEIQKEKQRRQLEGGSLNQELEALVAQQQRTVEESQSTQQENAILKSKVESLQSQVSTLQSALETARSSEQKAEEGHDNLRKQLQAERISRQERETQLETQVQELTSLLTMKNNEIQQMQQQYANSAASSIHSSMSGGDTMSTNATGDDYKSQYELTLDELKAVQTQYELSKSECQTLQDQLSQVLTEREQESSEYDWRQRHYENKIEELTSQTKRLESELREWKVEHNPQDNPSSGMDRARAGNDVGAYSENEGNETNAASGTTHATRLRHTMYQLDQSKKQIQSLSDQLVRQQNIVESMKSENIALKGRLQAATQRADTAEASLASHQNSSNYNSAASLDVEGGDSSYYSGSKTRRRVKTGKAALRGGGSFAAGGPGQVSGSKSIRASLGVRSLLHVRKGTPLEHVAVTIDAVDSWMMELSSMLRYEPLIRAGFALYLSIIHVWCFVLVCFHTVESEHGDLGALTHRNHQHAAIHTIDTNQHVAAAAAGGAASTGS